MKYRNISDTELTISIESWRYVGDDAESVEQTRVESNWALIMKEVMKKFW